MAETKFSDYAGLDYLTYTREDASSFPEYLRPLYEFDWADGKGVKWGTSLGPDTETLQLTWSVANSESEFTEWHYGWNPPINERLGSEPTDAEIQAVADAFAVWEQYVDVEFSQVIEDSTTKGNIRTIFVDMGGTGIAYLPPDGEINFSNTLREDIVEDESTFGEHILVHEIGHAVFGLADVTRLPGWDEPGSAEAVLLPWYLNNHSWTVMSYIPVGSTYSDSPMILDIAAIQELYGANTSAGLGDTIYSWNDYPIYTIWDVAGIDTIDLSNFSDDIVFNTAPGSLIEINDDSVVGIAEGVKIENFIGGAGNDIFYGGPGDERFDGGDGNDIFFTVLSAETVNDGGEGFDTVVLNSDELPTSIKQNANLDEFESLIEIEVVASHTEAIYLVENSVNDSSSAIQDVLNYVSVSDTTALETLSTLNLPIGQIYTPNFYGTGLVASEQDSNAVLVNPLGHVFLSDTIEQLETEINFNIASEGTSYSGNIIYNALKNDNRYEIDLSSPPEVINIIDIGGSDEIVILENNFTGISDAYYDEDNLVIKLGHNNGIVDLNIQNQRTFGTIEQLSLSIEGNYRTFKLLPDSYVMQLATTFEANKTTGFEYNSSDDSFIPGYKTGEGLFGGTDHSEYQDLTKIDEFIIDGNGNDLIFGSDGSDQIEARLGNDVVYGGFGNDRILGWQGDDALYGEAGNDRIFGDYEHVSEHGNDEIFGGAGNDYIRAEGGEDYIDGGTGDDVIEADGPGAGRLGISGNDVVVLSKGNDSNDGGLGNDRIVIDALFDNIVSFTGPINDFNINTEMASGEKYSSYFSSFENISFGDQIFTIEEFLIEYPKFNLTSYPIEIVDDENSNNSTPGEDISGDANDNVLIGTNESERIFGYAGSDLIVASDGDDEIFGDDEATLEPGNDWIFAGAGSDFIRGEGGSDVIDAGLGDDTVEADGPGAENNNTSGNDIIIFSLGNDQVNGGAGDDTLVFNGLFKHITQIAGGNDSFSVTSNFSDEVYVSVFTSIEYLEFDGTRLTLDDFNSKFNNNLEPVSNEIIGTSADDYSVSLGREDLIKLGAGDDTIYLSSSDVFGGRLVALNTTTADRISLEGMTRFSSVIDGDEDVDTIYLTDESNGDAFFLHDSYSGLHESVTALEDGFGRETVARVISIETINAGDGDDIIDLTSPTFDMNGVGVTLNGEAGNDTLWAAEGDDTLNGGAGDDVLFGGEGNDVFIGGIGADVFEFVSSENVQRDTIEDYSVGDKLKFYLKQGESELSDYNVVNNNLVWGNLTIDLDGVAVESIDDLNIVYDLI